MGKLPNILKSIYKIHPTAVGCGVCYWAKRRDLFHYSCHQFLNWWPQQSTGLLHLMVQIPLLFPGQKITPIRLDGLRWREGGICYTIVATSF